MNKKLFLALIIFVTSSFSLENSYQDVYICKGKSSKKYHYKSNCRGLSNCSTRIYKVKLKEAVELGRALCGWED